MGLKAVITCPNPTVCHQQNFLGIGLGVGVHRAGSRSRGDIPQPCEKTHISVDVEWQRLLLSEVTLGCFCVC